MATGETVNSQYSRAVMIVDDDEILRSSLTEFLDQQENLVVCAAVGNGKEAWDVLKRESIDVAIVDISLGQTNGLTLVRQIRQVHPNIGILILSADDRPLFENAGANAGASAFISKHESPETLLNAILQVSNKRASLGEP